MSDSQGVRHVSLRSGVYADSVRLMQVSRDIGARDGVTAVLVAMATPLNLELAAGMGLAPDGGSTPDQLLIALRATDDAELSAAVAAVEAALAQRERSGEAQTVPRAPSVPGWTAHPTPRWRSSACPARTPPPRPPTPSPPAAASCCSATASRSTRRSR